MALVERKSGQQVWVFRWFESGTDGQPRRCKKVLGSIQRLRKESDAWDEVERLGLGLTFDQFGPKNMRELIAHYRKTELPEEDDPEGLSFSTKDNNRCYLRKWIEPRWAECSLSDVKAVDVEAWLKKLKRTVFLKKNPVGEKPLAPGTRKKIRDLMHVLFEHAIRYEWTNRNPVTSVRQSGKRQSIPALIDVADLSKLLFNALALRERVMVFLDFGTGARRGELSGLKWEDMNFEKKEILPCRSIVKQHVGPLKTEASKKPIPLDDYLIDDLLAWRRETPYAADSDYVFASAKMNGKQPYWLSRIMQHHIKPIAAKMGIAIKGWHSLRHTYSTLLKDNGNDPKVVQELLRHANFGTTMNTYTQALSPAKREAHRGVIRLVVPRRVPRENREASQVS
jgi:integrase